MHSLGRNSGTIHFEWDAFSEGDRFEIFYEGALVFTTGAGFVEDEGEADVPFGPGSSTFATVRVTTGPGSTQWTYTISCLP